MSSTIVVKTGASGITVTAGTDLTFTQVLLEGAKRTLKVLSDPTLTARAIKQTYKAAKISSSAPNGYTQERKELLISVPLTLANGKTTVNTVRVEISHDVELDSAGKTELMLLGAQGLMDSDLTDFWSAGSTV